MGLKEAFRKVGQVIEETKMKIGMKKYKKGGIQVEEKDQKPEMVIPINDIPLPEEKRETEDAEIRKIEDLPAYEDRKFYIAAKMQVEPEEVVDLCQYFEHKKLKGYADFFNSSSSFCCGVI